MVGDLANDTEAETQAGVLGEEEVVAARSHEEVVAVRSNEEEVVAVPEAPDGGMVDASGDVVDIEIAETDAPAGSGDAIDGPEPAVSADALDVALAAIIEEASTM